MGRCRNRGRKEGNRRRNEEREEEAADKDNTEKREANKHKCKVCPNIIKRGAPYLTCKSCKGDIHEQEKCSGLKKAIVKTMNREEWSCEGCLAIEAEKQKSRDIGERHVEFNQKSSKSGETRTYKLLQCNIDSMSAKRN